MSMSSLLGTRLALPFRDTNYGSYAAGNGVSLIGTWMQRISIGWLTWELTQSGLWLGIMAFADFFPVLLSRKQRSLKTELTEGVRYTATHPTIAALLLLLIAIGVGGRPLNDLLPGFAAQVFRSGAGGLSILASATGAGAIIGGLWLGHRAHASTLTPVVIGNSVVGALAAILVSATDRLWVAVPVIAVFGFCLSSAGIAIQTLVQVSAAREMRGRVMGLYALIFRGAPAIGALAAGVGSAHLGLRWPIFIGSLVVIAACGWTYRKRDQIATALARPDSAADGSSS